MLLVITVVRLCFNADKHPSQRRRIDITFKLPCLKIISLMNQTKTSMARIKINQSVNQTLFQTMTVHMSRMSKDM